MTDSTTPHDDISERIDLSPVGAESKAASTVESVVPTEEPAMVDKVPAEHPGEVDHREGTDAAKQTLTRAHTARARRRPWGWIAATAVLGVTSVALGVNAAQSLSIADDWRDYANEVDAANHVLGEQVAKERSTVEAQLDEIDLLSEQLATAQQRITELADLTAQAGDNVQYYAQEINRLRETLAASASVSAALNRCVDGYEELQGYLKNPTNYDPIEVAEFEASLATLCTEAEDAHTELQKVLNP